MNTLFGRLVASILVMMAFAGVSNAASLLWSNNAGTPQVQSFDTTTGVKVDDFLGSGGNGRGVVVVGDVVYTTDADTGTVAKFDRATGAPLGSFVASGGGISTITFDGDNFWISDYTGANNAYYVSPTGVLLDTITLSESLGYYDGLEYFNGKLIANEFDGGYAYAGGNQYSVYDLDGNLLIKDFINTDGHGNGTGIAFDGTNFYISDIFNGRATIWSGADGSFLGALTLIGTNNIIEDLSFDFEGRPDTCRENCNGAPIPEPSSLLLLGSGLLGGVRILRNKLRG